MKITSTLALALILGLPPAATAQVCAGDDLQDSLQYLRRLSLDLRGRVPDYEELASVVTNRALDPAIVEGMLASEDFLHQLRAHHRDLLWTNVTAQRLNGAIWDIRSSGRAQGDVWYSPNRALQYRGGQVPCRAEPATFDAAGQPVAVADPNDARLRREGYVEVAPYWAPATRIKVCAFDAQTNLQADTARGPVDCDRALAQGCGCGPNLAWCQARSAGTQLAITESMNEQLLRYLERVVREGRPYTDAILGRDMDLNGPIAHWLRNQTGTGGNLLVAGPEQNHPVPELAFTEVDTWTRVERGARHAGVLTMPGYLIKFASDRGRANRFYQAFLCTSFESNEPIPPATDACHGEPDLTKRCGCKGCHTAVEPAAAHWGRWAEAGSLALNEDLFPTVNPACTTAAGARSRLCQLFYFTEADVTVPEVEDAYVGTLRAYVYADEARRANIEAGPERLAQQAVDSGAFARCTVQQLWTRLMGRAPAPAEDAAVEALADDFAEGGYRLPDLVHALVTRPEYVEAGRHGEED
jgi:hypothetical protein